MTLFRKVPFRCRRCERRFYRYVEGRDAELEASPETEAPQGQTEESLRTRHP